MFDDFKPIKDEKIATKICKEYIDYVKNLASERDKKELDELKKLIELKKALLRKNVVSTIGVGSANSGESSIDITYDWTKTPNAFRVSFYWKYRYT